MDKVLAYESQLDVELSKIPQLRQLEAATGVKKTHAAAGAAALLLTMLFFNIAGQLLSNLIGYGYPVYASLKAINTADKADDTQWLTYFAVFSTFVLLESSVQFLLDYVPFYWLMKSIFLVYLYAPQTNGAQVIFNKVLNPMLLKNQKHIDAVVDKVKTRVDAVADVLDKTE